jgi:hypothetical protein
LAFVFEALLGPRDVEGRKRKRLEEFALEIYILHPYGHSRICYMYNYFFVNFFILLSCESGMDDKKNAIFSYVLLNIFHRINQIA